MTTNGMTAPAVPRGLTAACLMLAVCLAATPGQAAALKTLARFNLANGANPGGALTIVPSGMALPAGTLLGTASAGGEADRGTVFALVPPSGGATHWRLQTISSFYGQYDLAAPAGSITLLSGGGMAGATSGGGPYWTGGIYTMTPSNALAPRGGGSRDVVNFYRCIAYYSIVFNQSPDELPEPVYQKCATEAQSSPPIPAHTAGFAAMHVEPGTPAGAPVPDGTGGLYAALATSTPGAGGVIHLTPPSKSNHVWPQAILFLFGQSSGDLSRPSGPLVAGAQGELYGAASFGGAHNAGGIYRLTPPAKAGRKWKEDIIWSFGGAGDGLYPGGDLLLGPDGDIYGTTQAGGTIGGGFGTVFQLVPPASGQTAWQENLLYDFAGNTGGAGDGATPVAGLYSDSAGNLYGTTQGGGANFDGTVYKLTKPASRTTAWPETILWSFTGGDDGAVPLGKLVADAAGQLYGTTSLGGEAGAAGGNALSLDRGYGTVFELKP